MKIYLKHFINDSVRVDNSMQVAASDCSDHAVTYSDVRGRKASSHRYRSPWAAVEEDGSLPFSCSVVIKKYGVLVILITYRY